MEHFFSTIPDEIVEDIISRLTMVDLLRLRRLHGIDRIIRLCPVSILTAVSNRPITIERIREYRELIHFMGGVGNITSIEFDYISTVNEYNRPVRMAYGEDFYWMLAGLSLRLNIAVHRIRFANTPMYLTFDLTHWRTATLNMQFITIHEAEVRVLLIDPPARLP